jgi:uncharacterized protein
MKGNGSVWYKSKWPWLLMAAPAFSVVGGIVVLGLALASNDGLVADDYYKRGLAINQTLSLERHAAAGGYRAHLMFSPERDRVRVTLSGASAPAALTLRLVHPTRANDDRILKLSARAPHVYEGAIEASAAQRWGIALEDADHSWRLSGVWRVSAEPVLVLEPGEVGG